MSINWDEVHKLLAIAQNASQWPSIKALGDAALRELEVHVATAKKENEEALKVKAEADAKAKAEADAKAKAAIEADAKAQEDAKARNEAAKATQADPRFTTPVDQPVSRRRLEDTPNAP